MYDELIKLINICLADNEISEKERKVIFNKAKQLGISVEECDIIIDSTISKSSKIFEPSKGSQKREFTPKKIVKATPPKLTNKEVFEAELRALNKEHEQVKGLLSKLSEETKHLLAQKEILDSNNKEALEQAFEKMADAMPNYVVENLSAKTKYVVTLNDCKLDYKLLSKIDSKTKLLDYFNELLQNSKWSMKSYEMKLERAKDILVLLIWIISILLSISLLNYGKETRPYSYDDPTGFGGFLYDFRALILLIISLSLFFVIQIKLKNRDKLKLPLIFKNVDINNAISLYFDKEFDFNLFLELAKAYNPHKN